jgi:hypothetical protein
LQPLDLAVFGDLMREFHKIAYERAIGAHLHVDMADFYEIYMETRKEVTTARNCRVAFRQGGLFTVI